MRFVKAKYEVWEPKECNSKNILESIERAAKVCYKSEGNIKEGSALPFVKGLIKRGHTSCLEHGSIYLRIDYSFYEKVQEDFFNNTNLYEDYVDFCYRCGDKHEELGFENEKIRVEIEKNEKNITTSCRVYTNARFIYEKCPKLFWDIILDRPLPDFISLFTPEENDPYRRQTIFFTADQRITEEFIRHRVASPNKESTRYCCYSSDKHSAELTFIIPPRLEKCIWDGDKLEQRMYGTTMYWVAHDKMITEPDVLLLLNSYANTEECYNKLTTQYAWRAEEARIALQLGTKADLVLTNSLIDWCYGRKEPVDDYICDVENGEVQGKRIKGFFGLRTDNAAHPQARELAIPLMEEFKRRGWMIE